MNLTEEQRKLLQEIVKQYDEGRKGEFIFNSSMSGSQLLYRQGHMPAIVSGQAVNVVADKSDFEQLAVEGMITLSTRDNNNLIGKPTESGIHAVHSGLLNLNVAKYVSRVLNRETGRIYIGHGHSSAWKDLRDFLERRLDLSTDEFNREPAAGFTTVQILERMLDDASFAFLVMTGEDIGADGTIRARENVVHEVGLFQGRLGMQRAIILMEEDCSEFSNIHGLTVIKFPKGNLESKSEIRRVLEREKITKK